MNNTQSVSHGITKHDFQNAINNIKELSKKLQEENITLERVDTNSWLIFDHDVTGKEFNERLEKIQNAFIYFRNFNQKVVGELREVYNAFSWIDNDYIKYINNILDEHDKIIKVLVNFNKDIQKLKHFTDIDTAWELLEQQIKLSKKFSNYMASLSQQQHLQDVDVLWNDNQSVMKDIQNIQLSLEHYEQLIKAFHKELNVQIKTFTETQANKLTDMDQAYTEAMNKFSIEQQEKMSSVEKALNTSLDTTVRKQKEKIEQWELKQSETLTQMSAEQSSKVETILKSLETERTTRNEEIIILTQKVKTAYLVAGGATILTVIQLFLNISGVL